MVSPDCEIKINKIFSSLFIFLYLSSEANSDEVSIFVYLLK